MAAISYSFKEIFNSPNKDNPDVIQIKKIVIPRIQRDYAQGRDVPEVKRVRERFLEVLHKAVTEGKNITLDFVYGNVDENGTMTPLDGQQRLTTLFLLHWYAAKKGKLQRGEYAFLKNFSYETRYSAREFCEALVNNNLDFNTESSEGKNKISEKIIDQSWFPLDWKYDPTISSMLNMLDAINDTFKDVNNLWDQLNSITFYFLPITDMGLTDDLYIKMNSRGKPLTKFENFKAEFERELRLIDEEVANDRDKMAKTIMNKIDREWTDFLWKYRNSGTHTREDNIIDDEFLRYFKFICDVICYENGDSTVGRSNDEFKLLEEYFSATKNDSEVSPPENENGEGSGRKKTSSNENIKTLERFFDCWCNLPADWFNNIFYKRSDNDTELSQNYTTQLCRIPVEESFDVNIFKDCLCYYGKESNKFPLYRMVLLYAIIIYLQNKDKVTETDFKRRLRVINNLIQNSKNEISDRVENNRMQAILKVTKEIILHDLKGVKTANAHFNGYQFSEEIVKAEYLENNRDMADLLFELEDHPLLYGQIGIVGTENIHLAKRFISLFTCDKKKIAYALMANGDYGQTERNGRRRQYGSDNNSSWEALFHRSTNKGFDKTKRILKQLLETNESFSDDILKEIAETYCRDCEENHEYPFNYYYIKYELSESYGKLRNKNMDENPYTFVVLTTPKYISVNSYCPYLNAAKKLLDSSKIDGSRKLILDDYGQRLNVESCHIYSKNNSFEWWFDCVESPVYSFISQNANGIDTEDRVEKLKKSIEKYICKIRAN